MAAIVVSVIDTLSGTATAPARRIPNSASTVSKRLSISTATRSCGAMPSRVSPFAIRAVAAATSRHVSVTAPSMSAGRSASHRPFCAIRSGTRGAGAWNQDMFAAVRSEVVRHRPGIRARRTIIADLADAADEGIGGADRWAAEIVACDAVIAVGQVLAIDREAPCLARGREREPAIEQTIRRLIRRALEGRRNLDEAAPIVAHARKQRARIQIPGISRVSGCGPGRRVDRPIRI